MGRGLNQFLLSTESPRSEISRRGTLKTGRSQVASRPRGWLLWAVGHPAPCIPEGWANLSQEGRGVT